MPDQKPKVRTTKLLAELLPKEDGEHGITFIREPSPEEMERIESADSP
jgi:hypothetical protein